MRCCSRLQRFDQTELRARSKMRVDVRALLGTMSELCLHRLNRVPAGHRLARDRVAPEGMVAQGGLLHDCSPRLVEQRRRSGLVSWRSDVRPHSSYPASQVRSSR